MTGVLATLVGKKERQRRETFMDGQWLSIAVKLKVDVSVENCGALIRKRTKRKSGNQIPSFATIARGREVKMMAGWCSDDGCGGNNEGRRWLERTAVVQGIESKLEGGGRREGKDERECPQMPNRRGKILELVALNTWAKISAFVTKMFLSTNSSQKFSFQYTKPRIPNLNFQKGSL